MVGPVCLCSQCFLIEGKDSTFSGFLCSIFPGCIDLVYFSRFRGRSHLNTDPLLKIRNMTTAVTFVYSVEINNTV